ncbi:MAG: AMP-binding protein [Hyphomicrobiales bacterium]|nr:AMP-binding protein [Hyphomicrobiales bacterium]MDE2286586.1 AMP-binding protein [Hyphomicrobiales bacterium]
MRHKDLGIWQTWTWAQVLDEVRAFSIGLGELGLKRGDKFTIIGTNRPRLYWAMCAGQALGAIPVPVYADAVAEEMAYVLAHAEVTLAVVEDQEQVDKLIAIAERLPQLSQIVYDEPRGLKDYNHARLISFEDVQAIGRKKLASDAGCGQHWEAGMRAGKGKDLSVILYTSGTTGRSKGVMLTYENTIISARNANAFDRLDENEQVIAYLPLAWIGDYVFSYVQAFTAGYCVNCPEAQDTVVQDRREIGTTYAFAPPRVYENLLTITMVRMADAGRLKRKVFDFFIAVARRWGEKILDREKVPLHARLLYALGDFFVYGPLKNQFGLSRVRIGYTAGEAIGPELFSFYRGIGLNLKQLYGQTEASVYVTAQPDGKIYPDTVGTASPDVELKISDSGEVLYRSPGVFAGYYKDPEKTAEVLTPDGWVHTGDAGFFDPKNGQLKIIDRAKDVGRLSDGTVFAPKYLENKLKFYPNIREAVAIGAGREFACAMINIDLTAVGSWAERNNVVYASYQELAANPRVYDLIAQHIDETNRSLSEEEVMAGAQIHRFLILHKELDPDDGELTRTQKLRRGHIIDRYSPLVEAFYDGSTEAQITTEVTFEDGHKGTIAARVAIRDLKPHPVAAAKSAKMERAA